MSIAEGAILKIALALLLDDEQTAINVFWAELIDSVGSGPLDESDVLDAVSNWMDLLYGNITTVIADVVVPGLVEVWVVDEPSGDLTPVGEEAVTFVPSNANDALPNGCAAVMSAYTADPNCTGRKFIPGLTDTGAADNNIVGAQVTKLVDFAVDWVSIYVDPNNVQLNSGVYSYTDSIFREFTGTATVNEIVGYQRRRKPGVGS